VKWTLLLSSCNISIFSEATIATIHPKIKAGIESQESRSGFFHFTKYARLIKSAHIVHEVIILKRPIAKLLWVNQVFIKGGAGAFHIDDTDSVVRYGNIACKTIRKKTPTFNDFNTLSTAFSEKNYLNILKLFICL